ERIVLGKVAHAAVLGMHMLPRRNRHSGEADDLAVAAYRLADRDRLDRHLVARRDPLDRGDPIGHHHAGRQARARDQHAVVRMQANDGCRGHLGTSSELANSEWRVANSKHRYTSLYPLFAIHYSPVAYLTPCRRNPSGSGTPASWCRSSSARSRSTASRA